MKCRAHCWRGGPLCVGTKSYPGGTGLHATAVARASTIIRRAATPRAGHVAGDMRHRRTQALVACLADPLLDRADLRALPPLREEPDLNLVIDSARVNPEVPAQVALWLPPAIQPQKRGDRAPRGDAGRTWGRPRPAVAGGSTAVGGSAAGGQSALAERGTQHFTRLRRSPRSGALHFDHLGFDQEPRIQPVGRA